MVPCANNRFQTISFQSWPPTCWTRQPCWSPPTEPDDPAECWQITELYDPADLRSLNPMILLPPPPPPIIEPRLLNPDYWTPTVLLTRPSPHSPADTRCWSATAPPRCTGPTTAAGESCRRGRCTWPASCACYCGWRTSSASRSSSPTRWWPRWTAPPCSPPIPRSPSEATSWRTPPPPGNRGRGRQRTLGGHIFYQGAAAGKCFCEACYAHFFQTFSFSFYNYFLRLVELVFAEIGSTLVIKHCGILNIPIDPTFCFVWTYVDHDIIGPIISKLNAFNY